jgi:lysophospholipase L1-like esterase
VTGRRLLALLAGPPVALAAVLGIEIQMARRGPSLEGETPDLDGRVGGPGPAETVVWLGDSTAAGVGVTEAEDSLPWLVASSRPGPEQLRVLAVSGARAGDVIDDQLPRLADLDPDRIYLSVGNNDAIHLTGKGRFRDQMRTILEALPDVPVVVLGPGDLGSPTRLAQPLRALAGWSGRRLGRVVEAEARRAGALFVDIGAETGPTIRTDPDRYLAADLYHPSPAGYRLWADAILDAEGASGGEGEGGGSG